MKYESVALALASVLEGLGCLMSDKCIGMTIGDMLVTC